MCLKTNVLTVVMFALAACVAGCDANDAAPAAAPGANAPSAPHRAAAPPDATAPPAPPAIAPPAVAPPAVAPRAAPAAPAAMVIAVQAPPLAEAPPRIEPGLTLTLAPRDPSGDADVRSARMVTLYTPRGAAPSPFMSTGPFQATWHGFVNVRLRGDYTFSAHGRGTFSLSVNGNEVLTAAGDDFGQAQPKTIRLQKGGNELVAIYRSPDAGDASVRLDWSSRDFPREPVNPTALTHDASDLALRRGLRLRRGRELLATLRCLKCHDPGGAAGTPTQQMPELAIDAPALAGVGARLDPLWMAHWITNPHALRPGATMPRVLTHDASPADASVNAPPVDPRAWHIAAYLATLTDESSADPSTPAPPATSPPTAPPTAAVNAKDPKQVEAGGALFVQLGCIGCHTLPDHADAATEGDRIPLRYVKAKWRPAALQQFLQEPQRHYQWVRMPWFRFTAQESASLAAFLLSRPGRTLDRQQDLPAPDVERGRQLVQSAGCLGCHTLKLENLHKAPALADLLKTDWTAGCMAAAAAARRKAPDFALDGEQRDALRAFAAAGPASLAQHAPVEFAQRQVRLLRCTACHARDAQNSQWAQLEDEVAALAPPTDASNPDPNTFDVPDPGQQVVDQSRPILTWVGQKLKPQWMHKLFAGTLEYKPRPWLHARMPAFPARAANLAPGLAMEQGFPPVAPDEPAPDPALAAVGKKLIGRDGGFGCNLCHGVGKTGALNVFEAQGVNFMYVKERLNHDYYMRWMLKPLRIRSDTRMPQFANEEGKTPFFEIYDGDAHKQFDAIWHYFLSGRQITPPNTPDQ